MNVLVLTNPAYTDWLNDICVDYMSEHLIFLINNKGDFEKFTTSFSYDIGVSFMYQYKVPAKELSHTWFNFHPAPLPEYKGRNLCYHAIMNGEKEFGATVHYMDEGFDTGDIIMVNAFPVDEWETAEDLSREAISSAKDLLKWYFPRIVAGEQFERHPNVGGTYYKKEAIMDTVTLTEDEPFGHFVRAVTYGDFCPKIDIGGIKYKIVRDK